MKFAVLFLAVMCACGGYEGDPVDNAVARFESIHGELSERCEARVANAEFEYMSAADIERTCRSSHAVACMYRYDAVRVSVAITEDLPADATAALIEHETLHVILECEGIADVFHSDAVWDY